MRNTSLYVSTRTGSRQWLKVKNPDYSQAKGRKELFNAMGSSRFILGVLLLFAFLACNPVATVSQSNAIRVIMPYRHAGAIDSGLVCQITQTISPATRRIVHNLVTLDT